MTCLRRSASRDSGSNDASGADGAHSIDLAPASVVQFFAASASAISHLYWTKQ
jgi:hypothetical protein